MKVADYIEQGYRAYPLDKTLGFVNLDYKRQLLTQRYGLRTVVDADKNILYVKDR